MGDWAVNQSSSSNSRFWTDALHLFALCGFAVAQPLFDLLGQNAEFFVAHRSDALDVLLLVLAVSVLLPAILTAFERLTLWIGPNVQRGIHLILVGLLVALIALPIVNRLSAVHSELTVAAAGATGLLGAIAYGRLPAVRSFASLLGLGAVAFPVLFLTLSPVSAIFLPSAGPLDSRAAIKDPKPIVLIVLDEFEATSLLDANKDIDAVRFPHFAALAKESSWFPKATTTWPETRRAVPAILTGREPREPDALPTVRSHPNNLFTWLGDSYRMNVTETLTSLCPTNICREPSGAEGSVAEVASDLSVIYLHIVLPRPLAAALLPPMDTSWKGFGRDGQGQGAAGDHEHADKRVTGYQDRGERFTAFIDSIRRGEPNTLHFLHILLPHVSYTYLPSGMSYRGGPTEGLANRGLPDTVWVDEPHLPAVAYQRFLLQLGYVDTLVGRLVARLKAEGLYDDTLLMITSDHGKSFRPGQPKRLLTAENAADILHVPLFVKAPGQKAGQRNERHASNVDILPTIADVIGAELPWSMDGRSLVDASAPDRTELELRPLEDQRAVGRYTLSELTNYPRLPWKLETFGSRTPLDRLSPVPAYQDFVGKPVASLPIDGVSRLAASSPQFDALQTVSPQAGLVPAHLQGGILGAAPGSQFLAFALNGQVQAVTRTTRWLDQSSYFSVMLPETAFKAGANALEIFEVKEVQGKITLSRVSTPVQEELRIVRNQSGAETLVATDGKVFEIKPDAVKGYLDAIDRTTRFSTVVGWAVNGTPLAPAARFALFVDGKQVYMGRPTLKRSDLVSFFGSQDVLESGFRFALPNDAIKPNSTIRLFGLSDNGAASELTIDSSVLASLKRQGS